MLQHLPLSRNIIIEQQQETGTAIWQHEGGVTISGSVSAVYLRHEW